MLFDALAKGIDADRMKGALYILWNKGIASYAIAGKKWSLMDENSGSRLSVLDPKDPAMYGKYLIALLESQHQEKVNVFQCALCVAATDPEHLSIT